MLQLAQGPEWRFSGVNVDRAGHFGGSRIGWWACRTIRASELRLGPGTSTGSATDKAQRTTGRQNEVELFLCKGRWAATGRVLCREQNLRKKWICLVH